jgi:hypothetical protein
LQQEISAIYRNHSEAVIAKLNSQKTPGIPFKKTTKWTPQDEIALLTIADANKCQAGRREGFVVHWLGIPAEAFKAFEKTAHATQAHFALIIAACKILYGTDFFTFTDKQIKEKGYEKLPRDQAVKLIWTPLIEPIRKEMARQKKERRSCRD